MTAAVGLGFGGEETPAVPDLPGPLEPEDLRRANEVPSTWVLLGADGPESMPGQWVDAGLSAWAREQNRVAWQHARWVLATSRARAGTSERVLDRERAGMVVAASLGWSQGYAGYRVEFARQVLERLPALGEAMRTGVLEERKALIFTSTLEDLDDPQARVVVQRLLAAAPELPYQRLRARVEQTAQAVDPAWAAARRAAAVARRRVAFRVAPSGAAELCGLDLPEEAAQDAHDRIVALGREVARRLRSAGIAAPVGPIESDVMLTLTGPAGAGLDDTGVIDHVVTRFGGPDSGGPDSGGPDSGGPDDAGPDDAGPDDAGPDNGGPDSRGPDDAGPDRGSPGEEAMSVPAAEDALGAQVRAVPFVSRVALRIGLGTVLGLDQCPGELPGHGVVTSAVAAAMAWGRTAGSWRLLLYDPTGALEHVLLVRPPAHGPPPVGGRRRGQTVEITASTALLDALHRSLVSARRSGSGRDGTALPGELELAAAASDGIVRGDACAVIERAARALATARARPAGEHPARSLSEADHRFPGAVLRAWVEARDRSCRAPGCSTDAVRCDLDHTRDWARGGRTTAADLGAFCRRDHRFKHDPDTGWSVVQSRPGHFTWTSPTGRVHHVGPEAYDPPPDPVARLGETPHPDDLLDPIPPPRPPGSPRPNRFGHFTRASKATAARLRRRAGKDPDPRPDPDGVAEPSDTTGADRPPF